MILKNKSIDSLNYSRLRKLLVKIERFIRNFLPIHFFGQKL